ncbi:peptidase M16 [Capnocytophaga stomatis]|uniref:M16 family metallopeptidase n=1 Tax=Capnocytophaga stomatis TaxID=1848904 RepID=UPI0019503BAA|nr:M16 family metallopeptidase [Capnocytophaga stomatis]GIJ94472.1 peptidase M16 [Capnocytophaga stomatis]
MQKFVKSAALAFLGTMLFQSVEASSLERNSGISVISKDSLSLDKALPFDNEVTTGTLSNGFQYFIRKNVEPKNRVTMYLAIKVGSILETESQLGLAHFLEHMNFNGLKHFPKNELVNYLQKAGVRFGGDLNAYTGFDQTVYQLPIASDDPELLKNGLLVMRDWAQEALLTSEEIDKERGVIMEEMRGGRGASQRMRDQYLPMLFNGSRYANRLPIGTEEVVTKSPYEELRKFHREWYRPDLQALIVVGDIDVAHIEKEVKRLFSDMKTVPNAPKREVYKVDLLNKNQFMTVTDPEMTATVAQIMIKHPETKAKTVGDYRQLLMRSVYGQMLNARLGEILQSANAPFLSANANISGFLGGLDMYGATVVAKPNELERGFKSLVRELERVQKHGFTKTEFDRAITIIQKSNETSYTERSKKKSEEYVDRYLNYYLEDEPAMSNEDSYQLTKKLLPTLTLKEVEALGKQYYVDINRDILIMAPEKDKNSLPNESQVNSWISQVEAENIAAYEDKTSDLPLLTKQPQKGSIVSSKNLTEVNAKELILSNGVKVILKPTTFKNDQILIRSYSPGGTSLYGDNDYFSASYANTLVNASGLGQLNSIEFRKYMTGKNVSIGTYIGELNEGVSGRSDKEGLKTAFELIYGFFTEPRIDDDIFQSIIARSISSMANQENDPNFVFRRDMLKRLYNGNIRRTPITEANLKKIDKNRALSIFKERFADASDFTFVITGSFTEDEIKPYLENYLAALPNLKRKEKGKDLGLYEPKKGFKHTTKKGQEQKVSVVLSYNGDYKYNDMENINMQALESVLTFRLLERLRENEGGVYGTGANVSYSKFPKDRYTVQIAFGTAVDKYQSLIKSALEEVEKIKKNGPTQEDLDKFKIEQKRQMELIVKENSFWGGYILDRYQLQKPVEDPDKVLKELEKVTIKSVQKVANKYLKEDRLFEFILLPDEVK